MTPIINFLCCANASSQADVDLPQVSHRLQVLHIQVVTAMRQDALSALPGKGLSHISAQKSAGSKNRGCDAADLQDSLSLGPGRKLWHL